MQLWCLFSELSLHATKKKQTNSLLLQIWPSLGATTGQKKAAENPERKTDESKIRDNTSKNFFFLSKGKKRKNFSPIFYFFLTWTGPQRGRKNCASGLLHESCEILLYSSFPKSATSTGLSAFRNSLFSYVWNFEGEETWPWNLTSRWTSKKHEIWWDEKRTGQHEMVQRI